MVADVLRNGNSSDDFYAGWTDARSFIVKMTRGYTMVSGVISNRHLEEPMEKVESGVYLEYVKFESTCFPLVWRY